MRRHITVPNIVKICQSVCEDIKIFLFFKMADAAILDFKICEILLADSVWRAQTHHCTKCCQNWPFCYGDIKIFQLVIIDAVVFIIWTFQYLTRLAEKCIFTPLKLFLGAIDPINGLYYQPKPKQAHFYLFAEKPPPMDWFPPNFAQL